MEYAASKGWRIAVGGSHCYAQMYCPYNDKACRGGKYCQASIWGTPGNPGYHARYLRSIVDNCTRTAQTGNI